MENRNQFTERVEDVREEAERGARTARRELGDTVVDVTGEYFPEAVRRRRRRDLAAGAAVGTAVGLVAGFLAGHR